MKRNFVYLAAGLLVPALAFVFLAFPSGGSSPDALKGITAEVYYSSACGCCVNYIGYLRDNGLDVKPVLTQDMDAIKNGMDIPVSMRSCHTVKIGDYFVEGHVPVKAIEKLVQEKPSIDGIAMPGMPSGSPGMPGGKVPFEIFSINKGQSSGLFVKL